MAITRSIRSRLLRALAAALALGGGGCTAYPSPPSQPAFDTDVQPIFMAHCTRCHGNGPDGGAANPASVPGVIYPDAGPNFPSGPFLTEFGDSCLPLADGSRGTCQNGADCSQCGAFTYAGKIAMYIDLGYVQRMPPPPAPPLNDWEMKVVKAWAAHPICSNSPQPDPTICPGP